MDELGGDRAHLTASMVDDETLETTGRETYTRIASRSCVESTIQDFTRSLRLF